MKPHSISARVLPQAIPSEHERCRRPCHVQPSSASSSGSQEPGACSSQVAPLVADGVLPRELHR